MKISNFEAVGLKQVDVMIQSTWVDQTTLRELLRGSSLSFVLEGICRWQSTMLCELGDSYVQQSQRYVTMDADGYILPPLAVADQQRAVRLIHAAFDLYAEMTVLKDEIKGRPQPEHYLYGIAVEDARYILPLAMKTNISVAMAGEKLLDLFHLLRNSKYQPLFTEIETELLAVLPAGLGDLLCSLPYEYADEAQVQAFYQSDLMMITENKPVVYLRGFSNPNQKVGLGALTSTMAKPPSMVLAGWGEQAETKAQGVVERVLGYGHESIAEQARTTFGMMFSLVTYHQQERHRLPDNYRESWKSVLQDQERPVVIPPAIMKSPFAARYRQLVAEFQSFQQYLAQQGGPSWLYFLLNCQQIKLITTTNARMDCGMLRERVCRNAQWEIRQIAEQKLEQLQGLSDMLYHNAVPSCVLGPCKEGKLSCGKGQEMRKKYGRES